MWWRLRCFPAANTELIGTSWALFSHLILSEHLVFDQMLTRLREAIGAESGRFPHVRSATMRRPEHRRERIVHNRFWHENASL